MMRPGDIPGRIFFILSQKSIIGASGFIHGAHGGHGFFWGVASQEILEEIFFKEWLMARNHYGSTEHTEDTEFFGSCFARNLWRKSLIKIWPGARNQSSEFRRKYNL